MSKREPKDRRICKCECGGWVRGVEDFGQLWTYCEKCTPVVMVKPPPADWEKKAPAAPGK